MKGPQKSKVIRTGWAGVLDLTQNLVMMYMSGVFKGTAYKGLILKASLDVTGEPGERPEPFWATFRD
ncbi:hypothetical protein GCM10008938_17380 [Deinococcus roseus]|uniref:Uncharacterized protein n=1 Tax=Deinococcus roseus TaxID=392414 RepID=A0ABQ2CXZ8_9DEIO|nr:hypothetical protein GCM10008938_17380 [Deinococcus roseus]